MDSSNEISAPGSRLRRRRRRFLAVAVSALAVLGIALAVTFTADTGSASISVSGGGTSSSTLLFPLDSGSLTLPTTANAYIDKTNGTLEHSSKTTLQTSDTVNPTGNTNAIKTAGAVTSPTWSVVSNAAGTVSIPGDLAVIDADTTDAGGATSILVTMYVTNLNLLQHDYSTFAWPIHVYLNGASTSTCTAGATGSWTDQTSLTTYLTNTTGYVSFSLPTGTNCLYDVTMDEGGSFYTVNTTDDGSTGSLGPNFFYTAQAIS